MSINTSLISCAARQLQPLPSPMLPLQHAQREHTEERRSFRHVKSEVRDPMHES